RRPDDGRHDSQHQRRGDHIGRRAARGRGSAGPACSSCPTNRAQRAVRLSRVRARLIAVGTQPARVSGMDASRKGDLMRTWRIACTAAVLALGLATAAHADEWNKLTYLTFSGPVNMPGITLPAGTYRFELMDPDSSRRVIRVSD